mmetsp:Transcript_83390/g.236584  ORF Transcript_83390/g.236584 Transcript_83390/m.236584 type:complete len:259 (+) Transcript_83390:3-779(+)
MTEADAAARAAGDTQHTHAPPGARPAYDAWLPAGGGAAGATELGGATPAGECGRAPVAGAAATMAAAAAAAAPVQPQNDRPATGFNGLPHGAVRGVAEAAALMEAVAADAAGQAPAEMMAQRFGAQALGVPPPAAAATPIGLKAVDGEQHVAANAVAPGRTSTGSGQEAPPKLEDRATGVAGMPGTTNLGGDNGACPDLAGLLPAARAAAGPAFGAYRYDIGPKDDVDAYFRNVRRRIEVELGDGCSVQLCLQTSRGR